MNTSITITLPEPVKNLLDAQVADSGHDSVDDYILALIVADRERRSGGMETWLMQGLEDASPEVRRRERERRVAVMRGLIQEGLDDLNAGRSVPAEEMFRELYERNRRMTRAAGKSPYRDEPLVPEPSSSMSMTQHP